MAVPGRAGASCPPREDEECTVGLLRGTEATEDNVRDLPQSVIRLIYSIAVDRVGDGCTVKMITRPGSIVLTSDVVREVKRVAGTGGPLAALRTALIFRKGTEHAHEKPLNELRSFFCEAAAVRVLRTFCGLRQRNVNVLTRRIRVMTEKGQAQDSAIELAVAHEFEYFLVDSYVQHCVTDLWRGELILDAPDDRTGVLYVPYSEKRQPRTFRERFATDRLRVPRNQNFISETSALVFLGLFTFCINFQKPWPEYASWIEITLWVFTFSYIVEEIQLVWAGGIFYLRNFFVWVGLLAYSIIFTSMALRIMALNGEDNDRKQRLNSLSYDVLTVDAILLWFRGLYVLDATKWFGVLIAVLQRMLSDGLYFFFMLAFSFLGFAQSVSYIATNFRATSIADDTATAFHAWSISSQFYALAQPKEIPIHDIFFWLTRGFLQDPEFDRASEYHPWLGTSLFLAFQIVTSILLFNLLIAIFNESYSNMMTHAEAAFLVAFSRKTFQFLKARDLFPFVPPFNLIEILLVLPLQYVLSPEKFSKLNTRVLGTLYGPFLVAIALFESPTGQHLFSKRRAMLGIEVDLDSASRDPQLQAISRQASDNSVEDPVVEILRLVRELKERQVELETRAALLSKN